MAEVRFCSKCGETKPVEEFYKDNSKKDGLRSYCKMCYRAACKAWYEANQEKERARQKAWREANPERGRAAVQAWREANPEKVRAAWQAWREANKDRRLAYEKAWREANLEQVRELSRARFHRRRARLSACQENYTAEDVRVQYRSQRGKCWHCGKPVGDDYHIDHLVPLARGGSNAANNIVISCPVCNLSKRDKLTYEFNGKLF